MALIDDFARREDITKATVITRALDCMQASYDSGHGGMPVTSAGPASGGGASDAELEDLRAKLKKAEERATEAERALQSAEDRARDAIRQRDAAEDKARNAVSDLANAQAQNVNAGSFDNGRSEAAEEEIERLRTLVAKQAATLEEKIRAVLLPRMQRSLHAMPSSPIAIVRSPICARSCPNQMRASSLPMLCQMVSSRSMSTLLRLQTIILSVLFLCSICSTTLWLPLNNRSKTRAS